MRNTHPSILTITETRGADEFGSHSNFSYSWSEGEPSDPELETALEILLFSNGWSQSREIETYEKHGYQVCFIAA